MLRDCVARVVLGRTVRTLRASIHDRDRLLGESASRRRLLHDLGHIGNSLTATCERLLRLDTQLREELAEPLYNSYKAEVGALRDYVEFVTGLGDDSTEATPEALEVRSTRLLPVLLAAADVASDARVVPVGLRVLCDDESTVWADSAELSRVLVRLIVNAIDANARGGSPLPSLRLSAETAGATAVIRLSDGGEAADPWMFSAWLRGETQGTDHPRLDAELMQCAAMVAAVGGTLDEAPVPESGFQHTFHLTLPARRPQPAPRLRQS